MNKLYEMTGNRNPQNAFLQRFASFRQSFSGDPQQQIQQLLSSGKVTQEQYNNAYQMAQTMMRMFTGK